MELHYFLSKLDKKIKKHNQKIVVIRNHQLLPYENIGNDIDLIIKEDKLSFWIKALENICLKENLKMTLIKKHFYCMGFKIKGINDKGEYLYLDFNSKFNWRGVDFFSTDKLVEESIPFKSPIYTSKENYLNSYITFCHSFLYGGFINTKYLKEYRNSIMENRIQFYRLFRIIFSKKQTVYLFNKINSQSQNIPRTKANLIRISIICRSIFKRPFYTISNFFKSYFH